MRYSIRRILKLGKNNDDIRILDKATKKEAVFTDSFGLFSALPARDRPLSTTSWENLPKPLRRKMARFSDERFSLAASICKNSICRSGNHVQVHQDRQRATSGRMVAPFKQANLHRNNPSFANFTLCFYNQDHITLQGLAAGQLLTTASVLRGRRTT